jgi:hypothetical protein
MSQDLILSDYRFLQSRSGFSARELLRRIRSPRLSAMVDLPEWIDAAADEAGVSRELMCIIPERAHSALTAVELSSAAIEAFCGLGRPETSARLGPGQRGPRNQLYHAGRRLRWLFDKAHCTVDPLVARAGTPFAPNGKVAATPANAATAALWSYCWANPVGPEAHPDIVRIWREFGFGDPLEDAEAGLATPFCEDVADIAREVVRRRDLGESHAAFHGIAFDLVAGGGGVRFVRQCHEAAVRKVDPSYRGFEAGEPEEALQALPWLQPRTVDVCRALAQGGDARFGPFGWISSPRSGDIAVLSRDGGRANDVAICLGDDEIADNTCCPVHGPGSTIATLRRHDPADVVRFYASAFPSRVDAAAAGQLPDWAAEAWEWCAANGIFDGTRPQARITRADLAVVAHRLCRLIRTAPDSSSRLPAEREIGKLLVSGKLRL